MTKFYTLMITLDETKQDFQSTVDKMLRTLNHDVRVDITPLGDAILLEGLEAKEVK